MRSPRDSYAALAACAPLPALIVGVLTMRHLGVSTVAWATNIAAAVLGLLIWLGVRRLPLPRGGAAQAVPAIAGLALILLPFVSSGMLGVHRWVSLGGFRLHAAAIAAPLIVACVAAAAARGVVIATAIAVTSVTVVALQPDAAQATSLAAGCAVVFVHARWKRTWHVLLGVALLAVAAAAAFVHPDPLAPVPHVEEMFALVSARGPVWAAAGIVALLLLVVPFFVAMRRERSSLALALGVYVALTIVAPAWGAFPVPVMGSGASPILGYFLALAIGVRGGSPAAALR